MNQKYLDLLSIHASTLKSDYLLVNQIFEQTSSQPVQFVHIKQRIWHLAYELTDCPICPVCNVKFRIWNNNGARYTNTCGYKCSATQTSNDPAIQQKKMETNIKRYGTKAPAQNKSILAKATATKIQRYGADGGEVWREKIASSMMEKHGVVNPSYMQEVNDKKALAWANKEAQEIALITAKRQAVWLERHGATNPMQVPSILAKATNTLIERYGVSSPMKSPEVRDKSVQTCLNRYGVPHHAMHPNIIRKAVDTNKRNHSTSDKLNRHNTQQHMSEDIISKLNDREWLIERHHTMEIAPTAISRELGVTERTIFRYLAMHDIEHKKFAGSSGERQVHQLIIDLGILDVQVGNRSIISPLELDIYIPSHKIAIEYCGLYWHSDAHPRMTAGYHKAKMDRCNAAGIRLITIFEDEWVNTPDIVKSKIASILGASTQKSIFARKCKIVDVPSIQRAEFMTQHHIQGDGPGSITYGLTHQDKLVACMTFIKQSNNVYTLNRYATSNRIPGGFSKLLKHFNSLHNPASILSFADLRWSNGNMYSANGFILDATLVPDYQWIVDGERQHKFNWRHAARLKNLPFYDSTKSESANMYFHGYYKLYNCGLQRWQLTVQ